jgi:Phage integrase, N-terminal SAM-like domain
VTAAKPPESRNCRQRFVDEYRRYLLGERGLAETSLRNYVPFAEQLLYSRFGQSDMNLSELTAMDVTKFVQDRVRQLSSGRAKLLVTALRSFLRYLSAARFSSDPEWDELRVSQALGWSNEVVRLLVEVRRDVDRLVPRYFDLVAALRGRQRGFAQNRGRRSGLRFHNAGGQPRARRNGLHLLPLKTIRLADTSGVYLEKSKTTTKRITTRARTSGGYGFIMVWSCREVAEGPGGSRAF